MRQLRRSERLRMIELNENGCRSVVNSKEGWEYFEVSIFGIKKNEFSDIIEGGNRGV